MSSRWTFAAALGAVTCLPLTTNAQSPSAPGPAPVVLVVQPGAVPGSPESVREAVSRELRTPVLPPDAQPARPPRGTLTIAVDLQHRLIVTYRDATGRQIFRSVTVPSDPVAVVGTIALLAGNLARDESGEILAQLEGGAPEEPAPSPPVPETASPPEPEPEPETVAPAESVAAAEPEPAPAPAPEPVEPEPAPGPESAPLGAHRRVHLGFEGYFGTAPRPQGAAGAGALDPAFTAGLSLSLSLGEHFTLGVNHLAVGATGEYLGTRLSFSLAPFGEASAFFGRRLQAYGQGGVVLQQRTGGGYPDALGVAPYAGAGMRVWITRNLSAGLGTRAYYVAAGGFRAGVAYLPDAAVLITGGIELAAHF